MTSYLTNKIISKTITKIPAANGIPSLNPKDSVNHDAVFPDGDSTKKH